MAIADRLGWSRLSPEKQRAVGLGGGTLGILLFVVLPILLVALSWSTRTQNEALHAAVDSVQAARGPIRDRREKKQAVAARYASKTQALAGYLAEEAKKEELQVRDTRDGPDVKVGNGKRYLERSTTVHLQKVGMLPLAKFLEALESSGHPLVVSRLNIHKREADSYDAEIGVTTWDRTEPASSSGSGSSEKGSGSGTSGTSSKGSR